MIRRGNPERMGVFGTENGFNFAVRVPDGRKASLLLYQKGSAQVEMEIPLPEEERIGEISALLIEPMEAGKWEYNYCMDGTVQPDIYAKTLVGREQFGAPMPEEPGAVHALRCALPCRPQMKEQKPDISYEDMILYKTHVRGFTKQRDSKVKNRGTFLGVEEKIPYLKALGINALELMPVYEFFELPDQKEEKHRFQSDQDECVRPNYWGYGSGLYFSPKAAYAAGKNPVEEFAHLVDSLHRAGIVCILEFYFGPDTNPGLVLDVLHYWQLTFEIDGFHLLGEGEWISLAAKDLLLKKTKLIFVGFDTNAIYGGKKPYYKNLAEHNLAYQQDLRRFLKGDEGMLEAAAFRMRRNSADCGVINYFADHDGFTMMDMVSYEQKHNEANGEGNTDGSSCNYTWNCGVEGPTRKNLIRGMRERQLKNAWILLMTSQGTPMIYGGDELLNSTQGNNNPYCQDNEIGWQDWKKNKFSEQMFQFVRNCVEFRKKHPVLHQSGEPRLMDYKSLGCPDLSYHSQKAWYAPMEHSSRCLGAMYCGSYVTKEDKTADTYLYLAYNMHWEPHELALPNLPEKKVWRVAADSSQPAGFYPEGEEPRVLDTRSVPVPARTVMILIGRME